MPFIHPPNSLSLWQDNMRWMENSCRTTQQGIALVDSLPADSPRQIKSKLHSKKIAIPIFSQKNSVVTGRTCSEDRHPPKHFSRCREQLDLTTLQQEVERSVGNVNGSHVTLTTFRLSCSVRVGTENSKAHGTIHMHVSMSWVLVSSKVWHQHREWQETKIKGS